MLLITRNGTFCEKYLAKGCWLFLRYEAEMSATWQHLLIINELSDLLGGVHAEGVHDVTEEEHVEFTLAVPVVDVADLLDS